MGVYVCYQYIDQKGQTHSNLRKHMQIDKMKEN